MEIDLVDKANFKCFKLSDESIYFGETLQHQSEGSSAQGEERIVRHGCGVQIFPKTSPAIKYVGYWQEN